MGRKPRSFTYQLLDLMVHSLSPCPVYIVQLMGVIHKMLKNVVCLFMLENDHIFWPENSALQVQVLHHNFMAEPKIISKM